MEKMLEIEGLYVGYRGVDAVHGISFCVRPGEIMTVIGGNGAGKSTTLNAIMGLLRYRGSITFKGQKLENLSTEARVGLGLGLVPEKRELFMSMSVKDNLLVGGYQVRSSRPGIDGALEQVFNLFPRLRERAGQTASTLSGGERQMLAMGRALMGRPSLLMLDEPSLGLAPLIVREIFQIINNLRATGVSVLLVEQNAVAALQAADYALLLENGSIVLDGSSAKLRTDQTIINTYLGVG